MSGRVICSYHYMLVLEPILSWCSSQGSGCCYGAVKRFSKPSGSDGRLELQSAFDFHLECRFGNSLGNRDIG